MRLIINKVVIINQTDIDTLLKSEGDSLPAKVRKYLNKKFKNTVLPVGKTDKAYIRREGTNEYTNPAKHLDEETYLSKMHAASDFQELLSASTFVEHVADDGRHPDAVRGWNYYKTYFLVPDSGGVHQAFEGIVKIKLIARGDCFYDITKIKNITDSTAGQAFLEAAGSVDNVSNNSIPYSVSEVKSEDESVTKMQQSEETSEESTTDAYSELDAKAKRHLNGIEKTIGRAFAQTLNLDIRDDNGREDAAKLKKVIEEAVRPGLLLQSYTSLRININSI